MPPLPPLVLTLISLVQLAVKVAPDAKKLIEEFKSTIGGLFQAGFITVEQQQAVFQHADSICAAILAGQEPDYWIPRPDPT